MTEHAAELSVELQALIRILGGKPEAVSEVRALLAFRMDWEAFLTLAQRHGVVPLLFRWLREHASDLVPPEWFARLRDWYHANAAKSIQLTHELTQIMGALAAAEIAAMPLRGPALAVQIYDDPTLRQFSDLDLLVHPADLPRAYLALTEIGYRSILGLPGGRLPGFRTALQPTVELLRGSCIVELHSAAMEKRLVDTVPSSHWWQETGTVELHGKQYRCLSRVNNLLLAAIHGSKHRWRTLKWIVDLSALLQAATDAEREQLLSHAEKFGLSRLVSSAMELADALRHDPERVQQHLSEVEQDRPNRLERTLGRIAGVPALDEALMEMRVFLMLKDRRRDVSAGYLSRIFVPRTEDLALVNLPTWLTPLYYPIRAGRLLGRAVWKLPSLLSHHAK
jgi:hypothetical protein